MRPRLFHIPFPWAEGGEIPIFSYGFMIMLGFIFSILYGAWRARREGEDPNHILDVGIYAVVSGILGSRLFYYIEFYDKHFANQPWTEFFKIWNGGIVFYGGLIGGMVTVLAFLKWHKLHVMKFADILATTIPLGLSFGRLGCFLNGCCWGRCVADEHRDAFYAVQFPAGSPAWERQVADHVIQKTAEVCAPIHATQLYEWAGAWILVGLLAVVYALHKRRGQVFAALFVLYGPLRYVIEGFREHDRAERMMGWSWLWDPIGANYMTKSQVVSIGILAAGVLLWVYFSLRGDPYEKPVPAKT